MKSNVPILKKAGFKCITVTFMVLLLMFITSPGKAQISVNTDGTPPDASSMLEVKSTNKGFLPPRINFVNRPITPATGLMIYQIDNGPGVYYYDGAAWQKMSLAAYDFWYPNGADIYFNTGRVSIGNANPDNNGLYVSNYVTGRGAVRGSEESGGTVFSEGYLGALYPGSLGLPISVPNVGVLGIKTADGFNGVAVYGWNNSSYFGSNYAGLFAADGSGTQTTNYGVYSIAQNANVNYAGYFKGRVLIEGNNGSTSGNDTTLTLFSSKVKHTRTTDTRAVEGISTPQPGYGIGIYGQGGYMGLYGLGSGQEYTGNVYGVYGYSTGSNGVGTRIGVYGYASGGATNWAGYFLGSTYISGDLRIGTSTAATGYKLSVNGKIACEEVLVQDMASWPDYVFKSDYKLMSLEQLEQNIKENGHLPGIPSASEIENNGLHLGNMQKQVVEKVEELTLYTIEQGKMLQELKKEIDALKAENASLRKALKK